jgi:hypothetical protein
MARCWADCHWHTPDTSAWRPSSSATPSINRHLLPVQPSPTQPPAHLLDAKARVQPLLGLLGAGRLSLPLLLLLRHRPAPPPALGGGRQQLRALAGTVAADLRQAGAAGGAVGQQQLAAVAMQTAGSWDHAANQAGRQVAAAAHLHLTLLWRPAAGAVAVAPCWRALRLLLGLCPRAEAHVHGGVASVRESALGALAGGPAAWGQLQAHLGPGGSLAGQVGRGGRCCERSPGCHST